MHFCSNGGLEGLSQKRLRIRVWDSYLNEGCHTHKPGHRELEAAKEEIQFAREIAELEKN